MFKQIKKELAEFESTDIQIVNGFFFNQKETIERIHRYLGSQYIYGDIDVEGNKKYFFNIVNNPCRVETKATDFDTKNINIQTAGGGDPLKTWYFERDLKFWMKDKEFGKVLNRIFDERPKYGTVVVKTIKGEPYFVDLRNFVVEQSADTLDQASYIIERHLYSSMEFQKTGKELGWNNVEEVIDEFRGSDKPYIAVFERYGEVEDETTGEYEYKRVYVADVGVDTKDSYVNMNAPHAEIILKEEEVDGHPYTEFHRKKIPGRWLGVGVVETLFEPQVRQNEIANLESRGDYYAALHVWQTRAEGINLNLNTDVADGRVIQSEDPINPIDMTERNLSYFQQATDKWQKQRDELTFSYDVIQGERLPAGTPLGSAQLAATMAGSHFEQLREDVALTVKEYLYKKIIPQFKLENSGEHVLRLAGEDLDKINNLIINQKAIDALFKFLRDKKKFPTKVQYEAIKVAIAQKVKQADEQLVKIPSGFYNNLKYKIDIDIVGEAKDTRVINQNLVMLMQSVTADPSLAPPDVKRKLFMKIAENAGINPTDLTSSETPSTEQLTEGVPLRAGGGVSRPTMPNTPVGGQTQQRI